MNVVVPTFGVPVLKHGQKLKEIHLAAVRSDKVSIYDGITVAARGKVHSDLCVSSSVSWKRTQRLFGKGNNDPNGCAPASLSLSARYALFHLLNAGQCVAASASYHAPVVSE